MKFGGFKCLSCGQVVKTDLDGMVDHKCPNSNLNKKGFFSKVKSIFD